MPRIKAKVYQLFRKFGQTFRVTGRHTSFLERRKLAPETEIKLRGRKFVSGPASKLFAERRREDKPVSDDGRKH